MSKFILNQKLFAKLESAYQTDPTIAGTDAVAVRDFSWSFADTNIVERNASTGTKLGAPSIFAGALMELKFKIDLKGSGAAGTAPEFAPILQACGYKETLTASTSAAYKLDSADHKSCAIFFNDDGDNWLLLGCRGNAPIVCEAGQIGYLDVTIKGHLNANPSSSGTLTPTYDSTIPVPMLATPLTIGGVSLEQTKFTIDPSNTMAVPAILNTSDGFGEIRISKRKTKMSMTVYPLAAASYPVIADFRGNVTRTLAMSPTVGSTAGNRWKLTFGGNARYNDVKPGDDEGLESYEIAMELLESALGADDELTLTFT